MIKFQLAPGCPKCNNPMEFIGILPDGNSQFDCEYCYPERFVANPDEYKNLETVLSEDVKLIPDLLSA